MNTNTMLQLETEVESKAPPSTVLMFAGAIGAGKTTIATAVARKIGASLVSFGDYLRRLAEEKGLEVTRESIQRLGDELVRHDARAFCLDVLKQQIGCSGLPLVIDGLRHLEVLNALNEVLAPAPEYLIYVDIDCLTQAKRLQRKEIRQRKILEELEGNPTEQHIRNVFLDTAALVLDGTRPSEELTQKVIEFLARDPEDRDRTWAEKNTRRIELAEKKSRGTLQGAELAEFDQLQTEFFDYLNAKNPRIPVDLERLAQIEARLKASEGK